MSRPKVVSHARSGVIEDVKLQNFPKNSKQIPEVFSNFASWDRVERLPGRNRVSQKVTTALPARLPGLMILSLTSYGKRYYN